MREHLHAPAAYPEVNILTGPLRKAAAAAGDAQSVSLWAGGGATQSRTKPAADIVRKLTP